MERNTKQQKGLKKMERNTKQQKALWKKEQNTKQQNKGLSNNIKS